MRTPSILALGMVAILAAPALAAEPVSRPATRSAPLAPLRVSADKTHFVRGPVDARGGGERFVLWGFNYDRDDAGRLLEDYWADEWDTVAGDFREMKALGANVVRVHLQFGRFLPEPGRPDAANLARLSKLVRLAEDVGLYLDVTGLGCYHKADVPAWYAALGEAARWDAQAAFWAAVAGACRGSPAIFCYDLMNEPILVGGADAGDWLPGPSLAGEHFVQRITLDLKGRTDQAVAQAWVAKLAAVVRTADDRPLVTVGTIPWAQVFKGAKPLFESPEVGGPLDFVSVHFYAKKVPVAESVATLKVYAVGKPLVVEEFFPLEAGVETTEAFVEAARPMVDGWVSFYWGKTVEENRRKGDVNGAIVAEWLERFQRMAARDASVGGGGGQGGGKSGHQE